MAFPVHVDGYQVCRNGLGKPAKVVGMAECGGQPSTMTALPGLGALEHRAHDDGAPDHRLVW